MQMSVPVKDLLGWIAALLTVVTFAQRSMIPLRVTAILANVFFIAYGAIGHFLPVLTLHVVLLPVNSTRLAVHLRRRVGGVRAGSSISRQGGVEPKSLSR
jgi:hypothetical protein